MLFSLGSHNPRSRFEIVYKSHPPRLRHLLVFPIWICFIVQSTWLGTAVRFASCPNMDLTGCYIVRTPLSVLHCRWISPYVSLVFGAAYRDAKLQVLGMPLEYRTIYQPFPKTSRMRRPQQNIPIIIIIEIKLGAWVLFI